MSTVPNHALRQLRAGKLAIGLGVAQARTVGIAQIAKTCGFDWLFIDGEHSSLDADTAAQIATASLAVGVTPVVRVAGMEHWHASRMLDNGAQGIVFPHVDDAAQARRCADACRYPPVGKRSMGGALAQLTGAAGLDMLHVPYKGEGPLTPDFLAGRIQVAFMSNPAGISLAKEGKLRVLAVLLDKRSPLLPDVPTFDEAGVPQVTVRQWAGVFGPPKLAREIVERLNKEVNTAVNRAEVREKLQSYGYAAEGSTPERLLETNRDDLALWRKLVREANIPLE